MSTLTAVRTSLCTFGLVFVPQVASAATFELNCLLGVNTCTPISQSFGTVTVTDIPGGVNVVVDTLFRLKFRNLFFNVNVAPTTIDVPAAYAANTFSLGLYNGRFDVGMDASSNTGFHGLDGSAFQILGAGISEANFIALDSMNFVHLAAHLFDRDECGCDTSLFVGGRYSGSSNDPGVPEPATIAITGLGLAAVLAFTRRRTV